MVGVVFGKFMGVFFLIFVNKIFFVYGEISINGVNVVGVIFILLFMWLNSCGI